MKRKSIDQSDESIKDEALSAAAEFLCAMRTSTGLGPTEFAKRAHISRQTVWTIETGAKNAPPRLETLVRAARAAGKKLVLTFEH